MTYVAVQDVERDPRRYFQRVAAGETLVVTLDEQPLAEIVPVGRQKSQPRPIGLAEGEFTVPDDFDAPLPEDILRDFEGP